MNDNIKTPYTEDEIHLLDYLIILAKHSRMIIYTTLGMMVVILVILLLTSNKYTAKARVMPPQQSLTLSGQIMDSLGVTATPGSAGGGLGGIAASMLGLKSPGDLYVGMLTGSTIFDRIIERFNLKKYYSSSHSSKEPFIEDIRKKLGKNAAIESGKDGIISIEVTDEDPKLAADMANAFVEELDRLLQEMNRKEAQDQLAFLEKERLQTNQNLTRAEEALRVFSEKTSVLQIDTQTKGMLEYIASLRANIDAKEVQIKVMQQQATPYNYDVVRLQTELKGLKEKLQEAEKQANQTCISDVCIPTSKVPILGLEYFRLLREAKYQEAIYQMYCKLVELARLDVAREVAMLKVVDTATTPEKKSKPKRLLITLVIGFGTFIICIVTAFIKESIQLMKKNEEETDRIIVLNQYLQPYKTLLVRIGYLFSRGKNQK